MTQGTEIDGTAVDELQTSFRGEIVLPNDAGYDDHRKVWNGSIDRRPAVIARCAGVADIRAAIRLARAQGLITAVRGGGHSFPGLSVCDDGMLIDLSLMKGIRVDPEARTARVQAGVLLADGGGPGLRLTACRGLRARRSETPDRSHAAGNALRTQAGNDSSRTTDRTSRPAVSQTESKRST